MTTLGRNDKCACGSGRKYKQCCMQQDAAKGGNKGAAMAQPENVVQALRNAIAHQQAGRLSESEAICRQILQRAPQQPDALYLLGLISCQVGKHETTVDLINQAIASHPANPAYYHLLGNALNGLGKLDESISCIRKAISLKPNFAEAYYDLGIVFQNQGKLDDAIASYNQAISISPGFVTAYNNLGNVHNKQGDQDAAVASYQKALSLKPDYVEALYNLGDTLTEQGKLLEAVTSFKKALLFAPPQASKRFRAEIYLSLGNAYLSLARVDEAVDCYQQALLLAPDYAELHNNYLMAIQYLPESAQPATLNAHRAFAEQFEAPLRHCWPLHENPRVPERRLKVGFVSGDFRAHPVGFLIEGFLGHLNRNAFEIFLYYNHSLYDEVTQRLKDMNYHWRSLMDVSDDHAAKLVRDDSIDILIDLSGHTIFNRLQLFARKPAPVQVAYLGYFDTTGLQSMDYILGDPYVLPPDEIDHYVETPWCLPDSYLCFNPPVDDVKVEELPAIRNGFVTFGSFNNLAKLNDAVVALWARVLQAVPDSRLFLKTKQFNNSAVQESVKQRFFCHGIDAARLFFEGSSSNAEHYSAYNRIDVSLDPFPFPGGMTSVNSLWMGVPILHLKGDRFISHAGESILINVGLPEWIAEDAEDYVHLATQLTADLPQLAKVRAGLREKLLASPLCDAPRFARNFEAALRGMWQQWC